jgi:hypothetical protein
MQFCKCSDQVAKIDPVAQISLRTIKHSVIDWPSRETRNHRVVIEKIEKSLHQGPTGRYQSCHIHNVGSNPHCHAVVPLQYMELGMLLHVVLIQRR